MIFSFSKMFSRWSGDQTASHSMGTRCSSVSWKRARRELYIQRINIHVALISNGNAAPRVDSTWWGMSPHSWALQMTSAVLMHYSGNTATSAGCPTTMIVLISPQSNADGVLSPLCWHSMTHIPATYTSPPCRSKKLLVVYTTQRFCIAVIRVRHEVQFWTKFIQSTSSTPNSY